jgi:septal ring factor EnvC (AmiA/AmiB activator)
MSTYRRFLEALLTRAPIRTFRERRDQYLQTLERTVKRLRANESGLQTEVERLAHELAATNARLADSEARLFQFQERDSLNGSVYPDQRWGGTGVGVFASPNSAATAVSTYMSPSNDGSASEAGSLASSTTTLVWVESKGDRPVQMHVRRSDDLQTSTRSLQAHISSKLDATFVSQFDAVIVAMEFVLK